MLAICASAIGLLFPLAVGTAAVLLFGRRRPRPGPVGLLLHTLLEKKEPHFSYYSPDKFAALLGTLVDDNRTFSTVSEAARCGRDPDSGMPIVVTFDDGFESFYSRALPLLSRHNIKVTVFPVAGFLGRASTWDTLPPQAHLTKEQVREIAALGHEIGSHTVSHANLTLLGDTDLAEELSRSKAILEDITGKPVSSLSFPFGQWNRRVWRMALSLGYTAATSYANCMRNEQGVLRLWGIYSFDSVQDVWERALRQPRWSNAVARGYVMPNFAKGTPMWKFRKNYALLRGT
jgi:peptidoglycan/xylan/chitin deacetylase (PgdA/CDA1 family)